MPQNTKEPRFPLTLRMLATVLLTLVFCAGGVYWVIQNVEDIGVRMLTAAPILIAAFFSSSALTGSALTGLSPRLKSVNQARATDDRTS